MGRDISQTEWRRRREVALDRDDYECQQCGKTEEKADSLHMHHNRPYSEGGGHEIENLRTICEECHNHHHAEDRRKGTLEDVKDIYLRAEAPVFRTKEITKKIPSCATQTTPKLKRLVERGFLEKGSRGVYYLSELSIEEAQTAGVNGIIVDGSLVEDGEYIGEEENIRQCEDCGRWYHSSRIDRKMKDHQYGCTAKTSD